MSKRIDFAIGNALSLKILNVHGAADPLEGLTTSGEQVTNPVNVHGAAAGKIECVHGACNLSLATPQQVSKVEVRRGPGNELWITLHE